jgi:prephenate dehydrogenase
MNLTDCQMTIVGLGLMGGSLGLALREGGVVRRVVGVARRPETIAQALELGVVDAGTLDLVEGVKGSDIVVLATPVRTIVKQVGQVALHMRPGAVLTDLGSTKVTVTRAMAGLPAGIEPVGGHPMCGKEVTGIEAAEAGLYHGATWVLTPLERTAPDAVELMSRLVEAVGARPLVMEPERHDRLVAAISHLPYLLAVSLTQVTSELGVEDAEVWELAASGFRDTSRLAASDVRMMLDILLTNHSAVAEMAERVAGRLRELAALAQVGDEDGLWKELERAAEARRAWGERSQALQTQVGDARCE